MPESTDGLPAIEGLAAFVAANTDAEPDKGTPEPIVEPDKKVDGPPAEPGKDPITDLAQFKTPKDMLKSYKEIQSFTTKVSQENKALKEQLAQMQESLEIQRLQATPQPTAQQQKKFDEQFIEDPEKAVEYAVEKKLQTARVADVLAEEEIKSPAEFQERYAYAMRLRQAYPQLVASPQGVRKLFELGDRYRTAEMKKNAERSIRLLLGDDADIEKFKQLIAKDKQPDGKTNNNHAYMPDTSSGIRPDAGKTGNAHEAHISAAAEKGDVDGVISGLFKRQLAAP
jgi:hypothetical protein